MICINHLNLNNDMNCFRFECVNPKQTLWLVLASCVLMLHVCMQLCFKHNFLKVFACATQTCPIHNTNPNTGSPNNHIQYQPFILLIPSDMPHTIYPILLVILAWHNIWIPRENVWPQMARNRIRSPPQCNKLTTSHSLGSHGGPKWPIYNYYTYIPRIPTSTKTPTRI